MKFCWSCGAELRGTNPQFCSECGIKLDDGKQTPMKGHPVFIAQHATATCCRGCLSKWYHIEKDKELTDFEVKYIVNIIMKWIIKQIN